jgi:multicomponent Na+:H+ antiporter subunit G
MRASEVVAAVALLAGAALCLTGAIGLQRFPDILVRMHAAAKPVSLGIVLLLAGAALRVHGVHGVHDVHDVLEIVLIAALQLLTTPIAAHMVGRAAFRAGEPLDPRTRR